MKIIAVSHPLENWQFNTDLYILKHSDWNSFHFPQFSYSNYHKIQMCSMIH